VAPIAALAHGGPPSAFALIAGNTDGPIVTLLNEGLALKRGAAWSYLCPSLWGEPGLASGKVPLARSANGIDTWAIGGDLYLLQAQALVPQKRPEFAQARQPPRPPRALRSSSTTPS
jgi:hypothetical protein